MSLFKFLFKSKDNVKIKSDRIDENRFKITTEREGNIKETTIVVFDSDEIKNMKKESSTSESDKLVTHD